ncbi:hypothetical protein pb186bvf_014533 [Paramecium bursaria]
MKQKQLWGKLKNYLLQKEEYQPNIQKIEIFPYEETNEYFEYNVNEVKIKQLKGQNVLDRDTLVKINENPIDNTGSFYWPSEQILAKYLIENQELLSDNIFELGSGKSGFCGLVLASLGKIVTITDGNEQILEELKQNLQENNHIKTQCKLYRWGEVIPDLDYNTAIMADCFFFEKYHNELLITIKQFKKIIAAAPSRGGSLERFIELSKDDFNIIKIEYLNVFIIIFQKK